jgi:uncharacterized protein with PhoU and TrkA domain
VRDDAEFSGVEGKFDSLISQAEKIAQVSDSTAEIAKEVIRDVDHELDEVVRQVVANTESPHERVSKIENNIKEAKYHEKSGQNMAGRSKRTGSQGIETD